MEPCGALWNRVGLRGRGLRTWMMGFPAVRAHLTISDFASGSIGVVIQYNNDRSRLVGPTGQHPDFGAGHDVVHCYISREALRSCRWVSVFLDGPLGSFPTYPGLENTKNVRKNNALTSDRKTEHGARLARLPSHARLYVSSPIEA